MPIVFSDSGLHLAVLNALIRREALPESELRKLLAGIESDEEEYRYRERELIGAAIDRLHDFAAPADEVARIECLDFDGGNEIYMLIEKTLDVDTGGEADYYELGSLGGIEALRSLTELDLDGHGYRDDDLDLSPLANHPSLAKLSLTGRCTHAPVLLTLPRLARLRYRKLDDESIVPQLQQRGVEIKGW